MKVELWAVQPGDVDKATLVERAARLCYDSPMAETKEKQAKFLTNLSERHHLSVFEHARWLWLQNADPYHDYWHVRYGTNITERKAENDFTSFVCSMNARSATEYSGVNPIVEPLNRFSGCILQYNDLSDSEKLAHASATLEISGVSRTCSHQLVRHRVLSISQRSQRYCAESDWQAIVPPTVAANKNARWLLGAAMDYAKRGYTLLRKDGIPKEDARFVLPNATPTRLVMTGTFANWLHFIKLRTHKAAQWEIRAVAVEIQRQLREVEPGLFLGY